MKLTIIFVITLVLLIPISVFADDELVPQWIKTNAGWWAGGQIDDTTFIGGLEYLISKDILNVDAVQTSKHSEGIPEWIKQTANWWSSNIVTDSEFLNSIKYLIENGIITIEKTPNDFYDIQNWQIYDHSRQTLGKYLEGYVGTITEGDFVYFAAFDSSQGRHGEILRYDTNKNFESVGAWSTFDAGENGVGNDPDSFTGIISDGQFLYFAPYHNGDEFSGEVLRYDTTKDFESVEAWSTFDPSKNGVGIFPIGFMDISFDGQFLYFAPLQLKGGFSHEILRYDTTKDFESVGAWSTFNPAHDAPFLPTGYSNGVYEKNYVYFSQVNNGITTGGEILRYDTNKNFESVGAWSTFDAGNFGIGVDPDGYSGIISDGQFLYFTPYHNGENPHGEVLRYDTTKDFESVEAWGTFDPSKNGFGFPPKLGFTNKQGSDAVGYSGMVFDGKSIYLVPFFHAGDNGGIIPHGNFLKFQAWK